MAKADKRKAGEAKKRRTLALWTPQEGPQVDAITADWCPILLYGGAKYGGKALALTTPILTYNRGWVNFGDLQVGDYVFGDDGLPCHVDYVSPIFLDHPCYKIVFEDGEEIIADADHQWLTFTAKERTQVTRRSEQYRAKRKLKRPKKGAGKRPDLTLRNQLTAISKKGPELGQIRKTKMLFESLRDNHSIPLARPLQYPTIQPPIHPYVLGAWLGDGTSAGCGFTCADIELLKLIQECGYRVKQWSQKYAYGIHGLGPFLKHLDLIKNKHIPEIYFSSSFEQRLALLQGLMDTDGHCDKDGGAEFSNMNHRLAFDVLRLMRTLGIKPFISTKTAKIKGRECGTCWRIKITTSLPIFKLKRKVDRQVTKIRAVIPARHIRYIEQVESVPTRCIAVNNKSRLFLAGKALVPTHNTDFLLGDWLQDVIKYGPHWQGIIFRRALTEFTEIKLRSKELFPKCGATWHEQAHEWRFPQGSILRLKYIERFDDISLYEGHSYSFVGIDELGDWEDQNAFFRCLSLNRYARAPIPTLRLRATCNPGGRGHAWIKKYFIDPAPGGYTPLYDDVLKCYRLFIPAKLEDNKIGLLNDPNYESRLMRAGSPALVRALRFGDWNIVAGAFFNTFCSANVIQPFEIPSWWTRFCAFDPGSSDPFAITWWCVSDGTVPPYPKGALICYREWYGEKQVEDGEKIRGLRLSVKEIAEGIKARELGEHIKYRVAGHDLWDTRKGPSDAELFSLHNIIWMRAEIKRKQGWRRMYEAITGQDEKPMAYWFNSCLKCIEHIPILQHSSRDAEDVEDSPLDHAPDSCRYAINSRPYATDMPAKEKPIDELFKPPKLTDIWSEYDNTFRRR